MFRVTSPARMSNRQLSRLIKRLAALLVLGTLAFGVFYAIDRHPLPTPSMVDRQIQSAEAAVRAAPGNVQDRLALGGLYLSAKRYPEAADQFAEVLKVDANNKLGLLGRAHALYEQADYTGAQPLFQKVVDISTGAEFSNVDPMVEEAHYWLGDLAVRRSDLATAETEFKSALAIDSADADAWYALGAVYNTLSRPSDAIDALRKAISFVPLGWREPYVALAAAYGALGRTPDAAWAQAMVEMADGQTLQARDALAGLAAQSDASSDVFLGLGEAEETLGNKTAAATWYGKAVAKAPDDFNAQQGLARMTSDLSSPAPESSAGPSLAPASLPAPKP
jgi:tetratricopeptide (TPR) repeat protein